MKVIEIQGHRGCRGLLPENTLLAFEKALEIGVHTLELDVCITGDTQVIVSHEPWMSAEICRTALHSPISEEEQQEHNMYKMAAQTIQGYDCGSKQHPRFPGQSNQMIGKPLLTQVIEAAEKYCFDHSGKRDPILYNIELKSRPEWDGIFNPAPAEFVPLVMRVIENSGIKKRCNIQSFDLRILKEMHRLYPDMSLALLIENELSPQENLDQLGFVPQIYSPDFQLVNDELVKLCAEKRMRLIPWTVNKVEEMDRMVEMGVDGLITDFPNLAVGRF